jgi:hypothetical protein
MEIKLRNKTYELPSRIGLLPSWKNNWLRKADKNDPELDYKWFSVLLDEPVDMLRNLPDEEYLQLANNIKQAMFNEIKPDLEQEIDIPDEE